MGLKVRSCLAGRRLPAPVYATLIDVTATGARIRSLVLMERGTDVEFDLNIPGNAPITVVARVDSRHNALAGARFEYQISFALMAVFHFSQWAFIGRRKIVIRRNPTSPKPYTRGTGFNALWRARVAFSQPPPRYHPHFSLGRPQDFPLIAKNLMPHGRGRYHVRSAY